jgi:hypothetical protein
VRIGAGCAKIGRVTKQEQFDRPRDDVQVHLLELGHTISALPDRDRIRACDKILDAMLADDPDPEAQQLADEWLRRFVS